MNTNCTPKLYKLDKSTKLYNIDKIENNIIVDNIIFYENILVEFQRKENKTTLIYFKGYNWIL